MLNETINTTADVRHDTANRTQAANVCGLTLGERDSYQQRQQPALSHEEAVKLAILRTG